MMFPSAVSWLHVHNQYVWPCLVLSYEITNILLRLRQQTVSEMSYA